MILLDRLYVVTGEFAKMSADCFPATKVKLFDFMSVPKRVRLNMKKTAHRRYEFRRKRSLLKLSEAKLIAAARLLVKRNPIKNLKTMNKVLKNAIEPPFLVETPMLDPFSSMAIINAATFKLKFNTIFEKSQTKKENFALLSLQEVKVRMMHSTAIYRMANLVELNARMVEIPLENNQQNLYVILPKTQRGLPELERQLLDEKKLRDWHVFLSLMDVKPIHIGLPKFCYQTALDMMPVYRRLGVTRLINKDVVDLSGISRKSGLCLSEHIVISRMKVKEKGINKPPNKTEMIRTCNANVVEFIADHPFFFVISEPSSNSILCMGRMTIPNSIVKNRSRWPNVRATNRHHNQLFRRSRMKDNSY